MTGQDGAPSPSTSPPPITSPPLRSPEKAAGRRPYSEFSLPFRRSNASLSSLFSSTTASASLKRASTPITASLTASTGSAQLPIEGDIESNAFKETIIHAFAPRIALLPSADTEDLLAQKGLTGGLLELLRPYGETIPGRVTIRDSTGSSKSFEDFSVRFSGLRDGLESLKSTEEEETKDEKDVNGYLDRLMPHSSPRLRTGGDIEQIEQDVIRHVLFFEQTKSDSPEPESEEFEADATAAGSFQLLYLRRLLSGLPVTPHETFAHPVACAFAVSSRNADPIEELRQLNSSTLHGDQRLPPYISSDFLRYYILIHDEEHDDVQRSQTLYEQMKRHFGLHCHLLRIRSSQCVPSDDDAVALPRPRWISAAEELSEIERREEQDDVESPGPCLYESDEGAVRTLVREMVTQSVIPTMERLSATWNDQVVSRRRGISGRFISLSKRWTPFSSSRSSSGASGTGAPSNSNYDTAGGFYRPDTPEAIMRRLADYAMMLRDFKLAHSVYELIRGDYNNDKAWKYYAGASEMTAITTLLNGLPIVAKGRAEGVDSMLEAAVYNYLGRCGSPFGALRTLIVAVELFNLRHGAAADEAAKWAARMIEAELVGSLGSVLLYERMASSFASRTGSGTKKWGRRSRKAALWRVMATHAWLEMGYVRMASQNLACVFALYQINTHESERVKFGEMAQHLEDLKASIADRAGGEETFEEEAGKLASAELDDESQVETETLGMGDPQVSENRPRTDEEMERPLADDKAAEPHLRTHRKSLIGIPADLTASRMSSTQSSEPNMRDASPAS